MGKFYVSEQEIADRAALLTDMAHGLLKDGTLPTDRVILRPGRIPYLTGGYFLLNLAYKQWRIPIGHYTEIPKIAALQTAAIMRFQPFRPVDPSNVQTTAEARCNEIFACAYALGIIERQFTPNTPEKADFWLRLLDIASEANIETLEPYIVDINYDCVRPLQDYTLVVHKDDKLILNALISIFELISEKGNDLLKP